MLIRIITVDAQMIQDTDRFKMDLLSALERVLHGKVKLCMHVDAEEIVLEGTYFALVITQCSMRHLYTLPSTPQPQKDSFIATAKGMERRRCNHHTLDTPLTTIECLSSVIDPKNLKINKNRYIVASQEEEFRRHCRGISGVPLIYVKRSVMVMEPMAEGSISVRDGVERGKFRVGLRGKGQIAGTKRKTYGAASEAQNAEKDNLADGADQPGEMEPVKKRKVRGPKGPNPLSVKKPRRKSEDNPQKEKDESRKPLASIKGGEPDDNVSKVVNVIERSAGESKESPAKRKRKRKHKPALLTKLDDKREVSEEKS